MKKLQLKCLNSQDAKSFSKWTVSVLEHALETHKDYSNKEEWVEMLAESSDLNKNEVCNLVTWALLCLKEFASVN